MFLMSHVREELFDIGAVEIAARQVASLYIVCERFVDE